MSKKEGDVAKTRRKMSRFKRDLINLCPVCKGAGWALGSVAGKKNKTGVTCPECGGTGRV
jgi:DnaJ-class molecular chaperone